jgi:Ca2+-transporting ATPase
MLIRAALMTACIVVSTLGWFLFRIRAGVPFALAQVEAFTVLAVCEWFNVLSCRSEYSSVFRASVLQNHYVIGGIVVGNLLQIAVIYLPFMNQLFHTRPLDLSQVIEIGAVASLVLWVEEGRKVWARRRRADRPSLSAAN